LDLSRGRLRKGDKCGVAESGALNRRYFAHRAAERNSFYSEQKKIGAELHIKRVRNPLDAVVSNAQKSKSINPGSIHKARQLRQKLMCRASTRHIDLWVLYRPQSGTRRSN
jgi:hypothetical protein